MKSINCLKTTRSPQSCQKKKKTLPSLPLSLSSPIPHLPASLINLIDSLYLSSLSLSSLTPHLLSFSHQPEYSSFASLPRSGLLQSSTAIHKGWAQSTPPLLTPLFPCVDNSHSLSDLPCFEPKLDISLSSPALHKPGNIGTYPKYREISRYFDCFGRYVNGKEI